MLADLVPHHFLGRPKFAQFSIQYEFSIRWLELRLIMQAAAASKIALS
jgi:hypothetical protein